MQFGGPKTSIGGTMKQRIQWVVGLFAIASASLAWGCGCASERSIQPVREVIVQQQPMSYSGSYCEPAYSSTMLAPVGERFTTVKTIKITRYEPLLQPVGERFTTVRTIRYEPLLQPVGERVIWVKHHHKMLKPVGERFISEKRYHHKTLVKPVGEKFIKEKGYHKALTKPVGEKITMEKNKTLLKSGAHKTSWQKSKSL